MQLNSIRLFDCMKYDGHFEIEHQIVVDGQLKSNAQNHLHPSFVDRRCSRFNYTHLFHKKNKSSLTYTYTYTMHYYTLDKSMTCR